MKEKIYAVIDTNVLVSSFFSHAGTSNPACVITAVLNGTITPLYSEEIIEEYRDVLCRDKFRLDNRLVEIVISTFLENGLNVDGVDAPEEIFPDEDDRVFYEVTLSKDDAYLVTGNVKHFPVKPFVVTPARMVEILKEKNYL